VPHDKDFEALAIVREEEGSRGCYIDIGGNQGQSIESIHLYKPMARIECFEPNRALCDKLIARYAGSKQVKIRNVGLSDKSARLKLFVPSYKDFVYDGLASLDYNSARSWLNRDTVYFFSPGDLKLIELECRVETLDSFRLEPIFIKIDVQGIEYEVVKGGVDTLRMHEPILLIEAFDDDPRLGALLASLGYEDYQYRNGSLVRGRNGGNNTFLMTRKRFETTIEH